MTDAQPMRAEGAPSPAEQAGGMLPHDLESGDERAPKKRMRSRAPKPKGRTKRSAGHP